MTDHLASSPPPASPRRRKWRMLAGALPGLTLACAGIGAWTIHRIWTQLPSVEHLAVYRPALPLRIFARDGELLTEDGIERREFVPLEHISPLRRHALLAAEDAKFYEHVALADGDFVYAEYLRGTCTPDVPPFIRSRYACGGAPASDAPGNDGKPDSPTPAAVDAAERERVLDLFRTED